MSVSVSIAALLLAFGTVDSDEVLSPEPLAVLGARAKDDQQHLSEPAAPAAPSGAEPVMASTASDSEVALPVEHMDEREISVTARHQAAPPGDPLEQVNAKSFEITQSVDRAVVRPIAMGYQRIVPDPVRSGIRNFINNLREPVAFLNFMLQHKVGKAAETVGRFAINSTVGAAGLFDIARRRPFRLPRRPNGFANTFGFYGVKPGPFLFLPLVGPTTLRDLIGDSLDRLVLPVAVGKPFGRPIVGIPIAVFSSLDQRAEFDEKLKILHKDDDPYAATREDYLHNRQSAIDALHVKRHKIVDPTPGPAHPDVPPSPAGR